MIELSYAILAKLGANILAGAAKKIVETVKKFLFKPKAKAVLKRAFQEFKKNANALDEGKGTKDKNILLEIFEEFFKDDRVIREFQFISDAQGEKINLELLEKIFAGICSDKGIDSPTFIYFSQAISYVKKEIERVAPKWDKFKEMFQFFENRFEYLDKLQGEHKRLFFAGIPDLKEKKEIQLPAIFVMPRARESVEVDDYRQLMREKQGDDEFNDEEIKLQRMLVKRETEKPPIKFDTVFNESANQRFVVLGKPGSGKSTLLKFLVLKAARLHLENHRAGDRLLFPILVEIRKFENALSKTNRTDYNILDFLYDSMRTYYNLDLPKEFFEKYLDGGRALLLFDGLDEVAAESRRAEIRQMIASFVSGYAVGNTVIVTSRIAGYSRAQFSTTDYRHFTLEDFNDEEINAFIKNWYHSRMVNEKEAEIKANDLKDALEKKPRIKELARNPLLLTIIGIIHRYEAQLPEDRLLLYDKATEALLYTWDNVKEIIDEKFKLSHRRRFLGQVAFYLQSLEKGDEAGIMIHRNELYNILLADFCKVFNRDNWEAQELVNDFLETIRTRAGLLVEQTPGRYGFVHKTFQEYFAARWIANETTLSYNLQIMIDFVDRFIDNAFWQETLLLALQALPETQALNVLKHIVRRDPREIEPYFYHNHYFVMKFIAEKGEWLNNKEFVENQINDFFHFSWNEGKDRSFYNNYNWKRFTKWLTSVSDSLSVSILSRKLLALAEDAKQHDSLRRDCAEALGKLGLKNTVVMERLLHVAEDKKQDGYLRRKCAEAVGNLGMKDKAAGILLHLAEDFKQDSFLRLSCASTVGDLGLKDKALAERLLHLAEDENQDSSLRRSCASALGNLGLKDKALLERLLHLAEDENPDGELRRSCAAAMGNLGLKDKAMEILLYLVEDEGQEGYLRCSCASALCNLGLKDKALLKRLLNLVEDKKQPVYLRCSCAECVSNLGLKDKTVVERLLYLAEDKKQDSRLQRVCASALGKLGLKDKSAEILPHLAEDEKKDGYLRCYCVEAIGKLGEKGKAVEILICHYLAETDKYSYNARSIYDSLWELTAV